MAACLLICGFSVFFTFALAGGLNQTLDKEELAEGLLALCGCCCVIWLIIAIPVLAFTIDECESTLTAPNRGREFCSEAFGTHATCVDKVTASPACWQTSHPRHFQ